MSRGILNTNQDRSNHPGASVAGASTSSDDTAMDPFLLDFGTSVNVNEDLRRVIRGEIQEIDESINTIGRESKKEQAVHRQLQQDLSHSHNEMTRLSRNATDQLENAHIHGSFLSGLENTLHADLVVPAGLPSAIVPPDTNAQEQSSDKSSPSKQRDVPHKQAAKLYFEQVAALNSKLNESSKKVEEALEKHRSTTRATEEIEARIVQEKLSAVLEEKKIESTKMLQELSKEQNKLKALKAATLEKRKAGGANAQRVADLTKRLDANRRKADEERRQLVKMLENAQEEVAQLEKETQAKKLELETAATMLEEATKLEELFKQNSELDEKIAEQQRELEKCSKTKEEHTAELLASKEKLAEAQKDLQEAEDEKAKALRLKSDNDNKHNTIWVPGQVEMSDIAKQKELLAKSIEESEKSSIEIRGKEKQEFDAKAEKKRMLDEDFATLHEQADALQTKMGVLEKTKEEAQENWNKEIEENLVLEKQLKAAIAAEEVLIQEQEQTARARREEATAKAEKELEDEVSRQESLIYVLKAGLSLVKKAESRILQLGEPFNLDEVDDETTVLA